MGLHELHEQFQLPDSSKSSATGIWFSSAEESSDTLIYDRYTINLILFQTPIINDVIIIYV